MTIEELITVLNFYQSENPGVEVLLLPHVSSPLLGIEYTLGATKFPGNENIPIVILFGAGWHDNQ
jgi:hypothetical protein